MTQYLIIINTIISPARKLLYLTSGNDNLEGRNTYEHSASRISLRKLLVLEFRPVSSPPFFDHLFLCAAMYSVQNLKGVTRDNNLKADGGFEGRRCSVDDAVAGGGTRCYLIGPCRQELGDRSAPRD